MVSRLTGSRPQATNSKTNIPAARPKAAETAAGAKEHGRQAWGQAKGEAGWKAVGGAETGAARARAHKSVTLTFDDGPHPVNTPKVLDTLKQFDAQATFFVTGEHAAQNPKLLQRIVAEGHTLGYHTYDHANLSKLTPAQISQDMKKTQAAIDQALGYHYELKLVRPPYGAGADRVKQAAPDKQVVLWNVDSNDWRFRKDDAQILKQVFEGANSVHARGASILLMHDIHPQTTRVLGETLQRLRDGGYDIQNAGQFFGGT